MACRFLSDATYRNEGPLRRLFAGQHKTYKQLVHPCIADVEKECIPEVCARCWCRAARCTKTGKSSRSPTHFHRKLPNTPRRTEAQVAAAAVELGLSRTQVMSVSPVLSPIRD